MFRILVFLLMPFLLFGYIDNDMDGVEDKDDLCPNTPMTDLVDTTGCTIKSLVSPHHFSLQVGLLYANDDDYEATLPSIELDYNYQKLTLQFATSYFDLQSDTLSEQGLNDSYLNLSYQAYALDNFALTVGAGLIIPTYESDDNQLDYTASLLGKYHLNKWSLSAGLGYVLTEDSNISNRLSYTFSTAYQWNDKLYSSLGYSFSENIYENEEAYQSLSWYNYYTINKNWFATFNVTQGLNSVSLDRSIGGQLGYYW